MQDPGIIVFYRYHVSGYFFRGFSNYSNFWKSLTIFKVYLQWFVLPRFSVFYILDEHNNIFEIPVFYLNMMDKQFALCIGVGIFQTKFRVLFIFQINTNRRRDLPGEFDNPTNGAATGNINLVIFGSLGKSNGSAQN